jgi:hypothetical protein
MLRKNLGVKSLGYLDVAKSLSADARDSLEEEESQLWRLKNGGFEISEVDLSAAFGKLKAEDQLVLARHVSLNTARASDLGMKTDQKLLSNWMSRRARIIGQIQMIASNGPGYYDVYFKTESGTKPVPGRVVWMQPTLDATTFVQSGPTDSDGICESQSLEAGTYYIWSQPDGEAANRPAGNVRQESIGSDHDKKHPIFVYAKP